MKNSRLSIVLIAAGGLLVIIVTLLMVHFRENEPIDPAVTNMIMLTAPTLPGVSRIREESHENGTYSIMDQTADGRITVISLSVPDEGEDEESETYLKRFIRENVDQGANVTELAFSDPISERLTYPVYEVCYEAGTAEDAVKGKGIVFRSDAFVLYYGYVCPADDYEDNVSDFDGRLGEAELVDLIGSEEL